jgi:hydrogenase nickel incorporation protein HypA/HybF
MHELAIALSIVDGVLEEAERHGTAQVETVYLRVGRLSGIDKDALLFSYRIACEDTALVDSRLVIEDIDVVIQCPKCRAERPTQSFPFLLCAECGTAGERVVQGEELEISRLEIAA